DREGKRLVLSKLYHSSVGRIPRRGSPPRRKRANRVTPRIGVERRPHRAARECEFELAGAARTAFLAKCKHEACAPKAVGSDGKPLKRSEEQLCGEVRERTRLTRRPVCRLAG